MDLELLITQYLDGTLSPEFRADVEAKLATDPQAKQLLAEHQVLDRLLRDHLPLPSVNFAALSDRLSLAIGAAEPPAAPVHYRIGSWGFRLVGTAVAALLVVAVGWTLRRPGPAVSPIPSGGPSVAVAPSASPVVTEVALGGLDSGPRAAVADVSVGPPPSYAHSADLALYDGIVTRPARIIVASGAAPAQDDATALPID